MRALLIPKLHKRSNLIHRHEAMHTIRKFAGDIARVLGKGPCRITVFPSALILQCLRQVPVVQRAEWLDSTGKQLVDDAIIEIEALCIRRSAASRKDSRPRNREAITAQPEILHESNVFFVPVVVIDGYIASIPRGHSPRQMAERIPDRLTAAVFADAAFYLVRGCR